MSFDNELAGRKYQRKNAEHNLRWISHVLTKLPAICLFVIHPGCCLCEELTKQQSQTCVAIVIQSVASIASVVLSCSYMVFSSLLLVFSWLMHTQPKLWLLIYSNDILLGGALSTHHQTAMVQYIGAGENQLFMTTMTAHSHSQLIKLSCITSSLEDGIPPLDKSKSYGGGWVDGWLVLLLTFSTRCCVRVPFSENTKFKKQNIYFSRCTKPRRAFVNVVNSIMRATTEFFFCTAWMHRSDDLCVVYITLLDRPLIDIGIIHDFLEQVDSSWLDLLPTLLWSSSSSPLCAI